jgi:ferredoxin-NADP reductase
MARFFDAELVELERPTEHLWVGRFRRTDGEVVKPRPGQFFMVHHEFDGLRLNRSYSLADTFDVGDELETFTFAVALVDGGRFSALLEALAVGDTLTMTGPHGRFILRDSDPAHTVLAATGTGIVPFRSMLRQFEERLEQGERVDLLYGCRAERDFLYHDEFVGLADRYDNFAYTACASRASQADEWTSSGEGSSAVCRCGRITEPLRALEVDPTNTIVYLCGNPAMIDESMKHFESLGFDRRGVRTEAYESPSDPPRG